MIEKKMYSRKLAKMLSNSKSAWPLLLQNRFCRLRCDVESLRVPASLKQLLVV